MFFTSIFITIPLYEIQKQNAIPKQKISKNDKSNFWHIIFEKPVGATPCRPCIGYSSETGEQSSPLRVHIQTNIIYIAKLHKHNNIGERGCSSPLRGSQT